MLLFLCLRRLIFSIFSTNARLKLLPDVALVTEADLKDKFKDKFKQNQKQIKEEKAIAEPEKSETEPSKFASAMALIDKNIKELSEPENPNQSQNQNLHQSPNLNQRNQKHQNQRTLTKS